MKVIVTGGAGFIGSHLTDKLIEQRHQVIVIDNLSTGRKENLNPKVKFYKADICDSNISQIFRKEKPKVVFHFAAQIDVRKSVESPIEDAKINILGTLNILENCRKYKVKKFIFASSVGIYGEPKALPIEESHPLNPISPYPITKLAIEKYLHYYQSLGLNFVSLRYSNIYGPRQSSKGEGGVVAIFIDRILKGKRPIIFGKGKQTRDFLYVNDAVEAAILSLKASPGSIYNVATNTEISIQGLLELLSLKLNKKIKPTFFPLRQGEIINSRIVFSKIKKELGWEPKFDLENGLSRSIDWFQQNLSTVPLDIY
ncbi:GDP-mannose 4,6-dehydratase [Patescibacteria group bacterium]|nr:GDP-mannose 4,6-dehydratase [Patescibacteria group bacterium]